MLAACPDSVPYFYGRITRENAELILLDRGSNDGMYLLRSCSTLDSNYVISMCFNKQVLHYRIEKSADGRFFLSGAPEEKYHGPIELVENIRILPCKLQIPCIKPLHVFMPGVNCGITDDKLQEAIQKKSKEWGLKEEDLNAVLEDKDSDIWKIILKSLHESEFWFHGKINRPDAEKRLTEHGLKDGTFLIREHDERSFSLSLCHSKAVKHYKIDVLSSGEVGIQDGPRFDNIISLVSHYSVFSDGLWCTLQQPCNRPNQLDLDMAEARLGLNNVNRKISSPIAAHRTGLFTKNSCSALQDENKSSKTSSKSKDSSTSKESLKKSGFGVWLKNPVAFLSRHSNEDKTIDKTNKPKPNKDNELADEPTSAINVSISNKKSIPPPVPKKLPTLSGSIVDINALQVQLSGSNTPTSSPNLSKDHNHNDCKTKDGGGAIPDEISQPSSNINHKLTIQDALTAHLSKCISERNVPIIETLPSTSLGDMKSSACNSNEDVPIIQNHATSLKKTKPVPYPRQKKISCPTLPLLRSEVDVTEKTLQIEHPLLNFRFSESGSINSSSHSSVCNSNETASSKLLQFVSPELDRCSDPQLILSRKSQDDVVAKDDVAVSLVAPAKNPASPSTSLHGPSHAFNLTSVISELKKHRKMNAAEQPHSSSSSDSNAESSNSSTAPLSSEITNISKTDLSTSMHELEMLHDATPSSEIKPVLSDSVQQKNGSEKNSPNEPLYEEIDPEYENGRLKAVPSCVTNLVPEKNEVPTVPSVTYEDSKWEDSRNDYSNTKMSDADDDDDNTDKDNFTSTLSERRKKFSKEQSEFHYKTIKRHRKGPETIDRKLICFQEKIGLGHFGQVMKAIFKSDKDEVPCAVKTLKRDKIGTAKGEILREARIMTSLDHPHIVRLLGICEGEPFLLVMELAPLGSLNGYLKHNSNIPVLDILSLMHQVAVGMEYLESKQFVHRDLAARNVLLVNESFAKISDFGMSKALGLHAEYYTVEPKGKLPLKWYAPECIYFCKFSTKSDVWSYGITLWEALSYGGKPYSRMAGRDILKMFATSERLACPKKCPEEVYKIMLSCWEIRPEMRPSFSKLSSLLREYTQHSS